MTLVEHLAAVHAEASTGGGTKRAMELLKTEMAIDVALANEVRAKQTQLTAVDKTRRGADYATRTQLKYITEALNG